MVSAFSLFSAAAFAQADTTPSRDNNMALGNPSGALTATTDSNNYLLVKSQYALSYNNSKGMANWVSWHLSSAWKGAAARCNCFTADASLPAGYFEATTSNYTGTGFDRGHLCPSDDRDGSDTDNAATFKMSNISPQAPVLNEQTWGDLENYCRTLIYQGKELYITAGGYGTGGSGSAGGTTTSIAGGAINVPAYFWKIIVVLNVDTNDVARINTSTRVITVLMPNNQTVNSHPWDYYRVSVDSIQTLTGYNFLSNVDTSIQIVLEAKVDAGPSSLMAWDFTNANNVATWAATSVDNNLDTSGSSENITRGSTAAASSAANSFRTTGLKNDGISTANTDYYQVKMKAKPGYTLSLSTIDASYAGTSTYCVSPGVSQQFAYSLDGSTFTLIGSPVVTVGSPATMNSIDISGISALQNVPSSQTIYLRYYATGQTSTGGWGFYSSDTGYNGLAINGTLAPISAITGTTTVCVGATTTLSDASTGGTWTSGATGTATVGSSSGIVTGVAAGTVTISYTVSGSTVTTIVTVNALATAGTVSGSSSVCVGSTITLTDATTGGVWSSGATGTATAGSTGIITGVAAGTVTISYGVTNSCNTAYTTKIITVNALPTVTAVNGSTPVCVGATRTLTDATSGGTWSSGSTSIATINTTGIVTGAGAGTSVITYIVTNASGCQNIATTIVTVNALPTVSAITGNTPVCVGNTFSLTDATTGGTWTSGTTAVATIASTGLVTGTGGGTSVITYKVTGGTGCTNSATVIASINAVPSLVLGPNPNVGTGVLKGFLSFTVTGSPSTYNLVYSSASHTAGFSDVTGGAVPASPLPFLMTIPSGVAAGVYSGTMSVTSAGGCASAGVPMTVTATTTGTWRTITNFAPHYNEGGMLLLTDGSVLVKTSAGSGYGTTWDKLTPVNGNYQNGTWSTIATMNKDRLYFSGQVLPDGRVYVCGGEYGTGGKYGEVYNPKTNSWTMTGTAALGNPFPNVVSDANSELLYNGKVLQASVDESGVNLNYLWDPVANTYSATANCLRVDNEAVWVKLPDSSVLFLDNYSTTSERYIPKTGTWVNDGVSPVNLYDPYGFEAGAGYTLPDGRVFFIGSTPTTAFYTPSGNTSAGTWAAGPALPLNLGAADAASAMMANGKVLIIISPTPTSANHFPSPAYYFEFDYTTNTFTEVTAPGGGDTTSNGCYISNTLDLPDGTVMFVNQGYDQYYQYVPVTAPLAAGKPTIGNISRTNCDSFSIAGTMFNGITEGAAYGDDWQMSTNYPIVRLTSGSSVYYATTYNWNRIGAVCTGSLPDTAIFALPSGMPVGTYSVQVVVNGNPSDYYILNTSLAISPATAQVCNGSSITLTDAQTIGVWSSASGSIATVGSATGVVNGVSAGTTTISYSINQCYSTATITVNALPTATTAQTNVSCFGGSNGTATVTPSGGASPYTYVWSPSGGSASTAIGLSATTYSCTVTDAHTCSVTKTLTITQPAAPLSATTAQTNVSCYNGTNGTASVTVSGGTAGYTYVWSPSGGTASSASGLAANTYTCTITDAHGCTLTELFTITQPATPLSATTSQTNVSCNGGNNGTASVTASGGTGAYAYVWSPSGGTASSASGLSAITYSCTITDANSCALVKTFNITQPSALTATTSQTNVSCSGGTNGTASVTVSGGTGSYAYVWSPSGGTASSESGLSAITYSCTITDANSCALVKTFSITQPATLTATTTQTNVSCNGGSNGTASVTPTGGTSPYTYSWSPAGGTASLATGLSAITYSCTITDSHSCSLVKTFTITQPTALSATTAQTNVSCSGGNNGTASVTVSGGTGTYTYVWSPSGGSASSATGLSAISYSCTITDANSCPLVKTFSITQPSALTATTSQTNVTCNGGSNGTASVTPGGGTSPYSYVWSPAGGTASSASGLSAITYSCTITDSHSCPLLKTFNITQPAALTIALGVNPTVTAGTPTANITYTVTSGSPSTYTIAYDAAAHTAGFTDVTTPTTLTGSPLALSVPVTATGGSYNGVITVSNGTCSSSGNAYMINISGGGNIAPVFTGGSPQALVVCENAGATSISSLLTVSDPDAGQTETWTVISGPANGTLSGFSTTASSGGSSIVPDGLTYTPGAGYGGTDAFAIQVSDGTATTTTIINVTVTPIPAAISGVSTLCVGAGATLSDATTGGTWTSSASGTVSVNSSGTINASGAGVATISYSTGCGTAATHTVTAIATPGSINGSSFVCAGSNITLTDNIAGGTWSSSNPAAGSIDATSGILSGLGAGSTTVNYTTGCGTDATLVVNVSAAPGSISGVHTLCAGTGATLSDAIAGGTWSSSASGTVSVNSTGAINAVSAGTATISYSTGCGSAATLTVTAIAAPGSVNGASTICAGSNTTLTDNITGGTWSSSNPAAGSIDATSGILSGLGAGSTTINYNTGCGTAATLVVSVNTTPGSIIEVSSLCVGTGASLSDAVAGGTWTSSAAGIISVDAGGTINAASTGTATISYSTGCGTAATLTVTAIATAGSISGVNTLCAGTGATLSDAVTGGTWTSSAAGIVSVGTDGSINALGAGTAIISYSTGCGAATLTVTAIPTPGAIGGASSLCTGTSITLTDITGGGTWSSANPATESVDPITGTVSGLGAGSTTISYNTGCGTPATYTVTAIPPAAPISGATTVCQGASTQLTDAIAGGTWTSSDPSIGSVDGTGMVTGTGSGSLGLSYYDGCGVPVTVTVNVMPIPVTIARLPSVCGGGLDTLTDGAPGGTWSGSVTGLGTIDPVSGILTAGTTTGVITLSYTTGCGDPATTVVTVNLLPDAGTITGPGTVCAASTINLTDLAVVGTWSSSAPSVATVGSSSGVVTGVASGTTTISYTVSNECGTARATTIVSVNSVSAGVITGSSTVNVGLNITLLDGVPGGTWSASNANATVSGGVVTGVTAGTVIISYAVTNGCGTATANKSITVNPSSVAPITGNANVCIGFTTSLSDVTTGGAWSSGNTMVATVASTGIVTGVAAGTATISYTVAGVSSTMIVTVNAGPSGIGGASAVCTGSSIVVSDFTAGGDWSSSGFASVVTIGSTTGLVTGVSPGTATITYSLPTGCYRTYPVNVNAGPVPISGNTQICTGGSTFLSDATSGGVSWTSSNTSVATISFSGSVMSVSAGTTTITYMVGSGCIATTLVTVNTPPVAITGNAPVCQGATLALSDATSGGSWTSSNTAKATVDAISGLVSGVSTGTATITYATGGSGCAVMTTVTVNPAPNAGTILGSSTVCTGTAVTLSDAASGGVWSSGAVGVASVTTTGTVTGVSAGTAIISYTVTNGCGSQSATLLITVSPASSAGTITGTGMLCAGSTTNLTDAITGGSWTSGSTGVATVSSTGLVTGVAIGTSTISYSVPGSCGAATATMVVTVTSVTAGTILGASSVYTSSSITLSDVTSGGVWSASNGNATVSATGLVIGVSAGTVTMSYVVTNSCGAAAATKVVTVNLSSVAPITGIAGTCIGLTTALTDATVGGAWSSSNTMVATVNSSGVVTGVAAGTATISYTVAGFSSTLLVTINTNPSGIGGATSVCVGSAISMSDFTPGGTWSTTANASAVSTGTASALVTGVTAGTAVVTYSLGSGCYRTFPITVNAAPAPIAGTLTLCASGGKTFVSDATTPGVSWTSGTTTVATITASGVVTGVAAGTSIITYTIGTGCRATATVTVNPLPVVATISGASTVSHAGPPITLSDATGGGVWTSTAPTIATVGSATGIVTAVASAGNTTISYTVTLLGCAAAATKVVTASAAPHVHETTTPGITSISVGATVNLADGVDGGLWGSSYSDVATVDDQGVVTGLAAGVADIVHMTNDKDGGLYTYTTRVAVGNAVSDIRILPNPNNGTFSIKGKLAAAGETVTLKITDMLGQLIYQEVITPDGGAINEQIKLNSNLANGMYILNVKTGSENSVFHFVIEK